MSFIEATRQNIQNYSPLVYSSGSPVTMDISKVGLLAKLMLRFEGTLNCIHATKTTFTKAAEAPFCLADRIKVLLNSGVSIWDTTGYGAYLRNLLMARGIALDTVVSGSSVYQFGNTVASGSGANNSIDFELEIPIAINDRDPVGLLLLQTQDTLATIRIDNAPASVLMTDTDVTATLSGRWYVHTEFYDVPRNKDDYPRLDLLHQVLEDQFALAGVGENAFNFARGNIYMKAINYIKIDGAAAAVTDVEKLAIKYNQSQTPYSILAKDFLAMQRRRYGRDLPKGVYVWDWSYQGLPDLGNHRDYINSAAITEFQNVINISSSATFGTGNNILRTVREQLVPMMAR